MIPVVSVIEHVVLVHGLWMRGPDMGLLRWRLRRCGYTTSQFSYASLRCSLTAAATRLQHHLQAVDADTIHLLGHSLGGLVIRRLLLDYPEQRPGRVVTLGTPHQGSHVAAVMDRSVVGKWLLGRSAPALTGTLPEWRGQRDLGGIAGNLAMGVGWMVPDLDRPNDGTITVAETQLPGSRDHLVLPVSHMGLLVSAEVVRQTCTFLHTGHFLRQRAADGF